MKNKLTIAFFVIGMGLSLPGGFLAGNSIVNILTYSLVSSLILAGLVFGLLTFLETKVPEFVEFLNAVEFGGHGGEEGESSQNPSEEGGMSSSPMESSSSPSGGEKLGGMESTLGTPPSSEPAKAEKPKNGKFGDHIMIDNIPIKNEPKLMAEAIRTMMAQDDPGTPSN